MRLTKSHSFQSVTELAARVRAKPNGTGLKQYLRELGLKKNRDRFQLCLISVILDCSRHCGVPGWPILPTKTLWFMRHRDVWYILICLMLITSNNSTKAAFWLSPGAACNWASTSSQKYANHYAFNSEQHADCVQISFCEADVVI